MKPINCVGGQLFNKIYAHLQPIIPKYNNASIIGTSLAVV